MIKMDEDFNSCENVLKKHLERNADMCIVVSVKNGEFVCDISSGTQPGDVLMMERLINLVTTKHLAVRGVKI